MKQASRIIILSLITFITLSPFAVAAAPYQKPQGWVADFAGALSPADEQKIADVIAELEQKTSAEIAVVTVPSLENQPVEELALQLFQQWGIGKKGKDNGILFLSAVNDRKVRIEVGYGLEGILPDGRTGALLDTYVIPEFKKGDYGTGMYYGTLAIAKVIAQDAGVQLTGQLPRRQQKKNQIPPFAGILVFVILYAVLSIAARKRGMHGGPRGPRGGYWGGFGGGFGGGGGGGFGGFGGGMSGGGGASRGW